MRFKVQCYWRGREMLLIIWFGGQTGQGAEIKFFIRPGIVKEDPWVKWNRESFAFLIRRLPFQGPDLIRFVAQGDWKGLWSLNNTVRLRTLRTCRSVQFSRGEYNDAWDGTMRPEGTSCVFCARGSRLCFNQRWYSGGESFAAALAVGGALLTELSGDHRDVVPDGLLAVQWLLGKYGSVDRVHAEKPVEVSVTIDGVPV